MGINISKVAFTYFPNRKESKNKYVLKDINIKINDKNEFIAIVGHTGSGKSTLIQLMNALLVPTVGSVEVDGNVVTKKRQKNLKDIRKKVGVVFQFPEYQLFEETVLKDVSFGPKNYKLENPEEKAKHAMSLLQLTDKFYDKHPLLLSGGEMRKVAISGILASEPEILILDEPTVGLDPFTKNELITLLENIAKEKTVIFVTHDMDVLWRVATRVIVLDNEKVVYDGDKYELFKDEEFLLSHSLDLPEIVKTLKALSEKLNMKINIYQDNIEDAAKAIVEAMKHE